MLVYIVNKNLKPLMPCKPKKARELLETNKAEVYLYKPFTIKLKHGSSGYKNEVVLGVDTGSENIGFAAASQNRVLFQAEFKTKTRLIRDKMEKRSSYRRTRRGKKTRYREKRFDNRKRPEGWLPPSIQSNVNSHIKMIKLIAKLLPITKIIIETTQFDMHAIKKGKFKLPNWQYQQGELYQQENLKMYIRKRDNYTCQECGTQEGILECHHIIPRSKRGPDKPDNLILLCSSCHAKTHKKNKLDRYKNKKFKSFAPAARTQMGKTKILEEAKEIAPTEETFGFITKIDRQEMGLTKTHYNDAVAIVAQGNKIKTLDYYYKFVNKGRGQYQLRKGKRSQMIAQSPERETHGFKRWDKIKVKDTEEVGFINKKRTSGQFGISDIEGNVIYPSKTWRKLIKLSSGDSILIEKKSTKVT